MYKGYKSVERERGVALIFTLAMLGLLMMMLLAFVGSMSVKKTVSSNAANKTQLNLLVDSAAARAALQMRALEEVGDPLDYAVSKPVSAESGGSGSGADSINSKFETKLTGTGNDIDLYKTGLVNNQHNGVTPEWINVTDSITGGVTPVARYAYAVIPNAYPILNLRALGNEARIGGALNEFKLSAVDSKFPNFTINTSTEKPYLTDKESYKILYLGDNLVDYNDNLLLAYTTIGDNLVEDVYFYDDYTVGSGSDPADFMLRRYDLGVDLTMNDGTTSKKFSEMLSTRRVPVLLFGNSASAGDEKASMKEFTGDDAVVYRSGGSGTYATNKSAEYLPFFKKFDKAIADSTFDEAIQLRNQIAANLIDYTMPDSATVTSDEEPLEEKINITNAENITSTANNEDWRNTENPIIIASLSDAGEQSWEIFSDNKRPNYTGNKRTLYLNEAGAVISLELTRNPNVLTEINYKVHIYPLIELIDIYGMGLTDSGLTIETMLDDYWMGMSGYVRMTIETSNGGNVVIDKDFPEYYLKPAEYITPNDGMYFLPRWKSSDNLDLKLGLYQSGTISVLDNSKTTVSLQNIDIRIDAAKLLKAPEGAASGIEMDVIPVDFANIDKNITGGQIDLDNSDNINLYASAYTYDPRQNLNSGDWNTTLSFDYEELEFSGENNCSKINTFRRGNSTFGGVNPHGYKDVNVLKKDKEDTITNDSANEIAAKFDTEEEERPISTAFIRQEPMESLWELGFIHRGIKWQTINLKAVQDMANLNDAAFDPEYENGDAEILDMVCLNYGERHKIDLNARGAQFPSDGGLAQKIWEELFSLSTDKIKIGNPNPDQTIELTDGADISLNKTVSNLLEFSAGDGGESGGGDAGGGEGGTGGSNIPSNLVLGSRNLFLRRSAIAPALYDAVENEDSDAKQEAYVGKVIGLTDAYAYPPEVRVIVQAELLNQQTGSPSDSVKKLVIMKRTLDGRYVISEVLPL